MPIVPTNSSRHTEKVPGIHKRCDGVHVSTQRHTTHHHSSDKKNTCKLHVHRLVVVVVVVLHADYSGMNSYSNRTASGNFRRPAHGVYVD